VIKAIIFDNNGVLTLSDRENTVSNFAKYFEIDESDLHAVFDKFAEKMDDGSESTLQFYQKIASHFGKGFDPVELRKVHIESYKPKEKMRELVLSLKNNYDVALLTNYGDAYEEANENVWHHDDLFDNDRQFVSYKLKMKKPNRDIYEHVLLKLGYKPNETVFIDDRESNLVPARELGMKVIHFKSPEQFKNELELLIGNENA
jgi:putative hydrolase of the HAD superfamily